MLTHADEYPIHQTAEPIAFSGSDPNFYDRYFFNGYAPDGSEFFAVAFGVYPHIGVADAHFSVIRDGVEHCVHASRPLVFERMDLSVGPVSITVDEPLHRVTVRIAETEGISAELTFEGRAFPIQEPRFTQRRNARMFVDYTRFTQNGRWSGFIEVDGKRIDLAPGSVGTRDRSWGLRPIGSANYFPEVPPVEPQFYWIWTPANLETKSVFFHINADRTGEPWNIRSVIVPDGATAEQFVHVKHPEMRVEMRSGTRNADLGTLILPLADGLAQMELRPLHQFQMRGVGYGHEKWTHGAFHGMGLDVEREDLDLSKIDPLNHADMHIQAISEVIFTDERDGSVERGIGVFEQLIIGPYDPLGLTGTWDPAP